MVHEFNGFTKGVIGRKLPSDSTLNNMKKNELIKLLHIAQHNYDTVMSFYSNAVDVNIKHMNSMQNIVERLEECGEEFADDIYEELRDDPDNLRANRIVERFYDAIEIVKEEGGVDAS